MISPFKVPKMFTKLMRQCYVAVPCGGGIGRNDRGYLNGFHDMRVVRDLYVLWQYLHAKAANLSHQPQYYSCHNEGDLEPGDMKFWEREVITILNCKFGGNATFEWFDRDENGQMVKTNGFDWLPSTNHTAETKMLLSQPALLVLFDDAKPALRDATKMLAAMDYDPVTHLVDGFDLKPERVGEYRLFAPLRQMMLNPSSDFVPYISTSSEV